MNALDRLLTDEINSLLERVAATVPEGSLAAATARHPTLRARLDETEARLAALRASLLETYGAWGRTLEDMENLWALAAWKREDPASMAA
jgi:O-methyltransferase involved in polyketide biosynthesis